VHGVYVAAAKGTPWVAGATLGDISWQIAGHGRGEDM